MFFRKMAVLPLKFLESVLFFVVFLAFNVPDLEKKPTVDVFRPPIGALAKVKVCMKDYFF